VNIVLSLTMITVSYFMHINAITYKLCTHLKPRKYVMKYMCHFNKIFRAKLNNNGKLVENELLS